MTDAHAHPDMLVLLRESRGMTQADVAEAMAKAAGADAAVSQGYVSKAEKGRLSVAGERLGWYAEALGYPEVLLCADPQVHGVGVGLVHHRKRAALTAAALRGIHAQLALTRLQTDALRRSSDAPWRGAGFPVIEIAPLVTPKDAARQVREAWGLTAGPIPDLAAVIENAGALVLVRDLGSDLLDAVSQRNGDEPPLLLINDKAPGDRCRFSLAHELGHLVMHSRPPAPDGVSPQKQERQADEFASELLMPAADIRSALSGRIDLGRLIELKKAWGVSMSALAKRAFSLSILTEWQYRTLMMEMSALGYRRREPVDVPRERPRRVAELVDRLSAAQPRDALAATVMLLPDDFERLYPQSHADAPRLTQR